MSDSSQATKHALHNGLAAAVLCRCRQRPSLNPFALAPISSHFNNMSIRRVTLHITSHHVMLHELKVPPPLPVWKRLVRHTPCGAATLKT